MQLMQPLQLPSWPPVTHRRGLKLYTLHPNTPTHRRPFQAEGEEQDFVGQVGRGFAKYVGGGARLHGFVEYVCVGGGY